MRRLEIDVIGEESIEANAVVDRFFQEILLIEEKDNGSVFEKSVVPHQIKRSLRFQQSIRCVILAQLQTKVAANKER